MRRLIEKVRNILENKKERENLEDFIDLKKLIKIQNKLLKELHLNGREKYLFKTA
ncbi:MAG: hypothetical protein AB1465_04240 [Patescibacteria group bacterium]